jgi:2,3-bisphosphoglycerate-dependent phosphoglycerate mutase
LSREEVAKLNIPTGFPLLYDLDADGRALGHRYLGDQAAVDAAIAGVAAQTSVDEKRS